MKSSKNNSSFLSLLHGAKLKATRRRVALLGLLSKEPKPLTVLEIQRKLGNKMNQVTMYRALEALVEAGIVRRVDFKHAHAHYELVAGRKHHHHLICNGCGEVEDFLSCHIGNVQQGVLARSKTFNSIGTHALEFFGVCKECAISPSQ